MTPDAAPPAGDGRDREGRVSEAEVEALAKFLLTRGSSPAVAALQWKAAKRQKSVVTYWRREATEMLTAAAAARRAANAPDRAEVERLTRERDEARNEVDHLTYERDVAETDRDAAAADAAAGPGASADMDGLTLTQRLDTEEADLKRVIALGEDGPGLMTGDVEGMFYRIREAAGLCSGYGVPGGGASDGGGDGHGG